jgi:hypothetical protein
MPSVAVTRRIFLIAENLFFAAWRYRIHRLPEPRWLGKAFISKIDPAGVLVVNAVLNGVMNGDFTPTFTTSGLSIYGQPF